MIDNDREQFVFDIYEKRRLCPLEKATSEQGLYLFRTIPILSFVCIGKTMLTELDPWTTAVRMRGWMALSGEMTER